MVARWARALSPQRSVVRVHPLPTLFPIFRCNLKFFSVFYFANVSAETQNGCFCRKLDSTGSKTHRGPWFGSFFNFCVQVSDFEFPVRADITLVYGGRHVVYSVDDMRSSSLL